MEKINSAVRIHSYGGSQAVHVDQVGIPAPAPGKVLLEVHAAGINAIDRKIREGALKEVFKLPLPATLGVELAGTVIAAGAGVDAFAVGARVFGPVLSLGAFARYVEVDAQLLASIPAAMSDQVAAALPVAGLTAWQALFEAGQLKAGQTVLIQGAAGGVGSMAVQFAKRAGAAVIATASSRNLDYVKSLGANRVLDYGSPQPFTDVAGVDLVLDLAGGDALDLLWPVLAADGVVISTAAPEIVQRAPSPHAGRWFQMHPDAQLLATLAAMVVRGEIKVEVSRLFQLDSVQQAIDYPHSGEGRGKAVLEF